MSEATENNDPGAPLVEQASPVRRRSSLPILVLAVLFVSATFLTWYFTWFGRDLTDVEIGQYLADEKHPRHVQHALLQVEQRLEKGDVRCRQWYPKLLELTASPEIEFRMTTAWVMGFDNKSEEFHRALLTLLGDREPLVRRNAALALIRFGDASGHAELLAALKPFPVLAPGDGVVGSTLNQGSPISRGTLLARVDQTSGVIEIRAPMPGKIESVASHDGTTIHSGETILTLDADVNSLWEVLRGLAVIGKTEDLVEVERYAAGVDSLPDRIKAQAALTAKAIEGRTAQTQSGVK
jgi:Biotin-requiring enzyme